ncbi:GNAT family N-acetyltransferase, partial [bacterium]|nr:GNAT family N-acetyltransferase [bacterium]
MTEPLALQLQDLAYELPDSRVRIGDIRLRQKPDELTYTEPRCHGVWSLGIHSEPTNWGNGYGTSAMVAMLDVAFRLENAQRVEGHIALGNAAALRCAQKAGRRWEGVSRQRWWRNGEWLDVMTVGTVHTEYERLWGDSEPHWNFDE